MYMSSEYINKELGLTSMAHDVADGVEALLTQAYKDGSDDILNEIREGRYANLGYTYNKPS